MTPNPTVSVAVVGGGYGGIAAARLLDGVADVTLIEPRETFVHTVASLRALVDPKWAERMFLRYDHLLERGRVRRDLVLDVQPGLEQIHLRTASDGALHAFDYVVLASGSTYPFPAKYDETDDVAARAHIDRTRDQLARARSVLLIGAGPVGLELAGEIRAMLPATAITLVDASPTLLGGRFPEDVVAELHRQLARLDIRVELDTRLRAEPDTAPGACKPFEVATERGLVLTADIWFRCFGVAPASGYTTAHLATSRHTDGHLRVTDQLQLIGQPRIFAIGDVTDVDEPKMAKAAEQHAQVVADNIRSLVHGEDATHTYRPSGPGISLPLGPDAGISYNQQVGLLGAEQTRRLKGEHLRLDVYRANLGLAAPEQAVTDAG